MALALSIGRSKNQPPRIWWFLLLGSPASALLGFYGAWGLGANEWAAAAMIPPWQAPSSHLAIQPIQPARPAGPQTSQARPCQARPQDTPGGPQGSPGGPQEGPAWQAFLYPYHILIISLSISLSMSLSKVSISLLFAPIFKEIQQC